MGLESWKEVELESWNHCECLKKYPSIAILDWTKQFEIFDDDHHHQSLFRQVQEMMELANALQRYENCAQVEIRRGAHVKEHTLSQEEVDYRQNEPVEISTRGILGNTWDIGRKYKF